MLWGDSIYTRENYHFRCDRVQNISHAPINIDRTEDLFTQEIKEITQE